MSDKHDALLGQGFSTRNLDLSPASDAFDDELWVDPGVSAAYVTGLLGDRRSQIGVISFGNVVMAPIPIESSGDSPRSLAAGITYVVAPDAHIFWPGDAAHVIATGNDWLMVETDPVGAHRFVMTGLTPSVAAGAAVAAGTLVGVAVQPTGLEFLGSRVQIQAVLTTAPFTQPFAEFLSPTEFSELSDVLADATTLLPLPAARPTREHLSAGEIVELRDRRLGRSQRAYYKKPPALVRGRGVWLFDEYGKAYLDTINNVTHIGHSHPRVTETARRQLSKLNTNTRFVYEGLATYADRIVETLPDPLEVVFFVCTGSEANDLALRISRQITGREDVVILDGAYHGNTTAVMGVSPNRYKGTGGRGKPATTHELDTPDLYRGKYRYADSGAAQSYARDAQRIFQQLQNDGTPPAAFIAESMMGTAGNIVLPDGYLKSVFESARSVGALCISDEVQVGVGRFGTHFWGFEASEVVPDLVTMGKPLGNGHPIAAVVTTREIADAFDDGVKYFNTFGGNPVSCAIGSTVLDVVRDEELQANALNVGEYLLGRLSSLKDKHELVGDVRGRGLYMGIELVRDRVTLEPAREEAMLAVEHLRELGVINYPTGVFDNVLKVKPPMVFDKSHSDIFVDALDVALTRIANNGS
jgi:4-aminobutyrate aminotransferase-like enzyme